MPKKPKTYKTKDLQRYLDKAKAFTEMSEEDARCVVSVPPVSGIDAMNTHIEAHSLAAKQSAYNDMLSAYTDIMLEDIEAKASVFYGDPTKAKKKRGR